jgi:hypothetical protein
VTDDRTLEQRLVRLEDERAIEHLKYQYTAYCDACYDADGITSLFVPDGRWVVTPDAYGGDVTGHQQMRTLFTEMAAAITWAQHFAIQPKIEVDADGIHATGDFYLLCLITAGGDAQVVCGTYHDTFVKVGGRWLFRELSGTLMQAAPWTEGGVRAPWGQRIEEVA